MLKACGMGFVQHVADCFFIVNDIYTFAILLAAWLWLTH